MAFGRPRRHALRTIILVVAAQLTVAPPAARPAAAAVMVGAGDIASCNHDRDEATAALIDRVVAADPHATVFTTGDNAYSEGTPDQFATCYDPSWGRHKSRTRPAPGNHEYETPGAGGYFGYFGSAVGEPAQGWYDYVRGSWHVVVLNSECDESGGCAAGSAQERWLRGVLQRSTARCTLAIWHLPRFSSSSEHGPHRGVQPFWEVLHEFGAEVVLSGHDHVYERFGPQTATGAADGDFGLRQFTVGTGGSGLYNFGVAMPNSEVRNNTTNGVLKLTLAEGSYEWQFLPAAGGTFTDSGTGRCHDAPVS